MACANPAVTGAFEAIVGFLLETKEKKMTLIKKKTEKVKYYSDLTKGEMVKIISEQKGLNLSALDRATKIDIEEIAKALNVDANYKGAK